MESPVCETRLAGVCYLPWKVKGKSMSTLKATEAATIAELRARARARLPRAVFDFIDGAADDELTMGWNVADLDALEWRPRVLTDVSKRDNSAVILGARSSLPLIVAPTGLASLAWARADVLLAQAASAAGVPFTISTSSSVRMEDIRRGAPDARLWFQVYLYKDRDLVRSLVARARAIGCDSLVITVDVPLLGRRLRDHRNRFTVPLRPTARLLLDLLRCPRWTAHILANGIPRMQNFVDGKRSASVASLAALMTSNMDASVTWDAITTLRNEWPGRLVLKGILHAEDAQQAVACGIDGIVVSNHGGRQMDSVTSTLHALPEVVSAVAGRAEVFMDGGIRRGSDIAKALALGATAVMAGRAGLYGVGAGGRLGADRAFAILADELDRCLALLGCSAATRLNPAWLRHRESTGANLPWKVL
jgi:isopentenyl diphosphate isomerase/L-lactate dehydrogenase-like FMN-dependent dehydrogenase